jgi:C-terminal processing protease CtpA/Prc
MLRENVLSKTIALIGEHYVFVDIAREIIERLRANTSRYLTLSTDEDFASAITRDMFEISRDAHLTLTLRQQSNAVLPPVAKSFLDNGIALIGITRFPSVLSGRGTDAIREISDAFQHAEHAYAVIIDIRDNPGGDGSSVALATSYLVPPKPQLLAIYRYRDGVTPGENWTREKLPREVSAYRPLADKPVCVLVSKDTFSAAEEFAYNLQQMKRATIIGERTKGGAHPSKRHLIEGIFVLSLPFAETINPISHANWERVGILPDIECPCSKAMSIARTLLINLMEKKVNQ